MALLPPTVSFPTPGEYLRYWDGNARRTKYLMIRDWRVPLVYPRRLGSVAAGGTSNLIRLQDLDPSHRLNHRYKMYIGVRPGGLYRIYHPVANEQLNWDNNPLDIDRDLTRFLTYGLSPHDRPTFSIWVAPQGFPGVQAINILERTTVLEVIIIAAKYWVLDEDNEQEEQRLDQATLSQLRSGNIKSEPISFGGEMNA